MNKKIATTIAAVLAVAVTATSAILFTGCGSNQSSTAATTVPATTKATTATTKPNGQAANNGAQSQAAQNSQNAESSQAADSNGANTSATLDADGYIDEQTAIATVRQQAGTGAQVLDYYKGVSPDGAAAWVVTVAPVSKSEDAPNVTYYVNNHFCYAAPTDDSSSVEGDDGYIDEQTAIANVKKQAGTGAQILDSYKGYAPDGTPAWVITVAPVSKSDDAENVVYYTNYLFCYAA